MSRMSRQKGTPCIEHGQRGPRYSRVWWKGRLRCGHVRVWEQAHGTVPEGWHVDHLCRNPRCIRLDHLEAVPAVENVRRSRATKLTAQSVAEIRSRYSAEKSARIAAGYKNVRLNWRAALAREFGVTPCNIKAIVTRRSWVA